MSELEKRLACLIKADGTIARGYVIDSCRRHGSNEYIITWKLPLQGAAKTNFAGTIGSSMEEKVELGFITVGLTNDPNQMQVHTFDATGSRHLARSISLRSGISKSAQRRRAAECR